MKVETEMVIVGFTGTRKGMTLPQQVTLRGVLCYLRCSVFSQGECQGADEEAAWIAWRLGCAVESEPGVGSGGLSPFQSKNMPPVSKRWAPKHYIKRNEFIVEGADFVIACPFQLTEQFNGGTWWTIKYAREKHASLMIIWPDGNTQLEHWPGKFVDPEWK